MIHVLCFYDFLTFDFGVLGEGLRMSNRVPTYLAHHARRLHNVLPSPPPPKTPRKPRMKLTHACHRVGAIFFVFYFYFYFGMKVVSCCFYMWFTDVGREITKYTIVPIDLSTIHQVQNPSEPSDLLADIPSNNLGAYMT